MTQPQPPYVPGDPQITGRYPQPTGFITTPPPKRKSRITLPIALLLALAIMAVGFGAVMLAPKVWYLVGPDTGVAACEALAQRGTESNTAKSGDPRPMVGNGDEGFTNAEYQEIRSRFEHSRDEELRRHGTAFVDAMWQVLQIKPGEEMGALAYLGTVTSSYAGLTGACGKHGHVLPPINS